MDERPSDEHLMNAIRNGSKDAFRKLMTRWQRPVYQFMRLMGVDASEGEDGVQEVFLRIFAYRHRYRPIGSGFRAFLFHVSRNVAIDVLRKARRMARSGPRGSEPTADHRVPFWNDSFDCQWALDLLPERLRIVVVLNVYEGLSYRETAEALQIPVGTVKSRMYYALARLREVLDVEAKA